LLLDRAPWSERLAVGELDRVAVGIRQAAVVADRKWLLARRPEEAAAGSRFLGDSIDRRPAVEGKAEVAVVPFALVPARPAGQDHQDELRLAARLGQPHHLPALSIVPIMDGGQAAVLAIEGNAGREVAHMQRHMGEGRGHDAGP
jgi:hypothetical protein